MQTLKRHNRFLITTHVNPDFDAVASALAVACYLKSLKKKFEIVLADPLPERFFFLPGSSTIKTMKQSPDPTFEVSIVVDCGDLDRIGSVKELLIDKKIVNIDHHITNDYFGDINIVLPGASSSAEVIYGILKKEHIPFTKNLALLLYVGIMTDTGSFRYDCTRAMTHTVVADLLRYQFPISVLYRKIYETIPFKDFKRMTEILSYFELACQGAVAVVVLTKDDLEGFSDKIDLRDKIFTHLRAIEGIEVIIIFSELEKSKIRINFRSQGRINVAQLAQKFSGGGHKNASGCLMACSLKEAREKVLREIKRVL